MSLIDGIGDEVTDFFIVMSVLLVGWLAWCSTSIADQPLIRTVLILRDRTPGRITTLRANHQARGQNTNITDRPPSLERTEEETVATTVSTDTTIEPTDSSNGGDAQSNCPDASNINVDAVSQETLALPSTTEDLLGTLPPTPEEVLLEAMDSYNTDQPSLLQRPLETNNTDGTDTKEQNTPADTKEQTTSTDAREQTTSADTNEQTTSSDAREQSNSLEGRRRISDPRIKDPSIIMIKLKFINDDRKLVFGNLKQTLGEFKRKYFQIELEAQKTVRLVFNGRVLQPDTQTLEQCGLYDECVVHCWVQQARPISASSSQASTLGNSSTFYLNAQVVETLDLPVSAAVNMRTEWDLSRLLVSILTIVLGLAWYSRYHYAQLFTATTTLALYILTAIFTVSLISTFFPDQDALRSVE